MHDFIFEKKGLYVFEKKRTMRCSSSSPVKKAYWIWAVFWKKTNMTFVFFRGEAQKEKQPSPSLSRRQPEPDISLEVANSPSKSPWRRMRCRSSGGAGAPPPSARAPPPQPHRTASSRPSAAPPPPPAARRAPWSCSRGWTTRNSR